MGVQAFRDGLKCLVPFAWTGIAAYMNLTLISFLRVSKIMSHLLFLLPVAAVQVTLNSPTLVQPQLPWKIQGFADGCAESMEVPPEPQSMTALMNLEHISQNNPYLCLFGRV